MGGSAVEVRRRKGSSVTHSFKTNVIVEQNRELLRKLKVIERKVNRQEKEWKARETELEEQVKKLEAEVERYQQDHQKLMARHQHLFAIFKKSMQASKESQPRLTGLEAVKHKKAARVEKRNILRKSASMRYSESSFLATPQRGGSLGRKRFPVLTLLERQPSHPHGLPHQQQLVQKEEGGEEDAKIEAEAPCHLEGGRSRRDSSRGDENYAALSPNALPPHTRESGGGTEGLVREGMVSVTFRYPLPIRGRPPCNVQIAGSFNDWKPQSMPLLQKGVQGRGQSVSLGPGSTGQRPRPRPTAASIWSTSSGLVDNREEPLSLLRPVVTIGAQAVREREPSGQACFAITLRLQEGKRFEYKYVVDHQWVVDNRCPTTVTRDGILNNYIDLRH